MGSARIIGYDPAIFDDQSRCGPAGIFTMNEHIGSHFAENNVPQTAPFNAFQVKGICQVLFHESKNAVITINQIGAHQVAIIITIHIHLAQNEVGTMCRAHLKNDLIFSKQHHSGEGNTGFSGFGIGLEQLRAFQQINILQFRPGMILTIDAEIVPATLHQIFAKISGLYPCINPIFTINSLLTLIKLRYLHGLVGNIKVSILVAVVDSPIAAVNLRAFRHINTQQLFAFEFIFRNGKVGGR